MSKIKLTFNDTTEKEFILNDSAVNANASYDINTSTMSDSITMYKTYRGAQDEINLEFRNILNFIENKIIKKIEWLREDGLFLFSMEGLIVPSWNLNMNPEIIEMLNFNLMN